MIDLFQEQRRRLGLGGRRRAGRSLDAYLPPSAGIIRTLHPLTRDPLEIFDRDIPRVQEYARRWRYYQGDQYTAEALAEREKESGRRKGQEVSAQLGPLYAFIRSYYNIVPRVVNTNVDSVYRAPVQFQPKKKGNDKRQAQIDTVVRVSELELELFNVVRYASVCGDVYLRVGVDPITGKAAIFVHSPDIIRVQRNPFNKKIIDYAIMSYQYEDTNDHTLHMRTDIFWPEVTRTFRDGELFNFGGEGSAEQPNPLGVVPIKHIKNLDVDLPYGVPSYGDVLPTMDVINEVLAFLVNILKINADPIILAYGIQQGGLKKGHATDMNATTVWYIPNAREGGTVNVEMLEWKGNLPDMIAMLTEVKKDVQDSLPELHLSKIQDIGTMSGFAMNSMMFPFVQKTTQLRTIHTHGMGSAMSMALTLQDILDGSSERYDPLDEDRDVDIKLPPVLPLDEDAELNRIIALLEAGLIGEKEALRRIGTPDDQIDEILSEAQADQTRRTANASAAQQRIQGQIDATKQSQTRPSPAQRARANTNGQPVNNQLNSATAKGS